MTAPRLDETTATAEQREQYDRDGFLLLDSTGCAESRLDSIVRELAGLYRRPQHTEGGVLYSFRRIKDAWRINDNIKALALAPAVLGLLESLYERKPTPFQTINFRTGSEQSPHSDALHFNSMPAGFMAGVWVALEDIDMENGPLVYYPGSHRLPEITMQDVGVAAEKSNYPQYERYVAEQMEREGIEPRYATMRKGQAIVWASNLVHGGAEQRDPERSRHSQVTHVFFEGCRYYQPMFSESDATHWLEFDPVS